MGLVLPFPTDRAARRRGREGETAGATILFFTGIRYERWEPAPATAEKVRLPRSGTPARRLRQSQRA